MNEDGNAIGKLILALVILIVLVAIGFYFYNSKGSTPKKMSEEESKQMENTDVENTDVGVMPNKTLKDLIGMTYQYSGILADVTDGKNIRGTNTGSASKGTAKANYKNGVYDLFVTFKNLPAPAGTDFYEGWVVRKGLNFNVISTGELKRTETGLYINSFQSKKDLTDHDFYVLTLEPDDGDPAPADHILEGTLEKRNGN